MQGPIPKVHTKRKRKKTDDDMDSDNEVAESDHDELEGDYVSDEEMGAMSKDVPTNNGTRGTVLITLRNVAPYTEWYSFIRFLDCNKLTKILSFITGTFLN